MTDDDQDEGPERFRAYVEAKQRNIDWSDTLRNGSTVDDLLWKGSKHLTRLQRAGILIFAFMFLFVGAGSALIAWEQRSRFVLLIVLLCLLVAVRLIRNALKRNLPQAPEADR